LKQKYLTIDDIKSKQILVSISDIVTGKRFRKDMGDLKPLEKSIAELNCLLHPIVVESLDNEKWKLEFVWIWYHQLLDIFVSILNILQN